MSLEKLKEKYFLPQKSVLVLGAGQSGVAASHLLLQNNFYVKIFDDREENALNYFSQSDIKDHKNLLKIFNQKITKNIFDNVNTLVVSPGVPLDHELILFAKNLNIKIMSEIDCAFLFLPRKKIVGVTGTNGKSTCCKMLEHVFMHASLKAKAAGNIGVPLSEIALDQSKSDLIVLELSSYQCELTKYLELDAAILLNISPDHLDRYENFRAYEEAKLKIFSLLSKQGVAYLPEKYLQDYKRSNPVHVIETTGDAVEKIAAQFSLDKNILKNALKTFKALPHRFENLGQKNGVTFINDSKATNVAAVKYSLEKISEPIHLLLGGLDKGEDFSTLNQENFSKLKCIYAFGKAKEKIDQEIKDTPIKIFDNLKAAFQNATQSARAGETVLLSPACASFDQFQNFIERGELFKKLFGEICVKN